VLAAADADGDQAADDVVDSIVDLPGTVGAVLEQEEQLPRRTLATLLDHQPKRDSGPGLDLLKPSQPRKLTDRLTRQLPHAAYRPGRGSGGRAGDPRPNSGEQLDAIPDSVADRRRDFKRAFRRHRLDPVRRLCALAPSSIGAPAHPRSDRRPAARPSRRADYEAEM